MTPLNIALIVVGSVVAHGFLTGVTWALFSSETKKEWNDTPFLQFAAFIWPIVLPGVLGARLVKRLTAPTLPRAIATMKADR